MQHQNVSLSWVVSFFGYSNQLWRCISSSVFQESWLNTSISYYCCIAEKTVCPSGLIRVFNNWYWWKITTVRCICICNYTMIHFCAPVILASQYNLAEICVLEILSFSVCCLTMGYHQDYNPDLLVGAPCDVFFQVWSIGWRRSAYQMSLAIHISAFC